MPVNTTCDEYNLNKNKWSKCRVVVSGEEAVKEAGIAYLPMLKKQSVPDYIAYKERALFYGAAGRTVTGLLGAIFRKNLSFSDDNTIKEEMKNVTNNRKSIYDLATLVTKEVIVVNRVGVLLDAPENEGNPYLTVYLAESIINWKYTDTQEGQILSMVVLKEKVSAPGKDEFVKEEKTQYRVLELVEGEYQQRLFEKDNNKEYVETKTIVPSVNASTLDYIPFVFINSNDTSATVYDSPILPLVNVNLSHYRSSADLEHGRHFTGLPTAWVAGFDMEKELYIGSQVAWVSEDPQANAGFLEFTGQGLQSLENALKEKQEMMAVLGARMLEVPKKSVESGLALSNRYRGENSILGSISNTVGKGLTYIVDRLLEWRGITIKNDFSIKLNSDFINDKLSASEIKDLMAAWQGGALSWETLFYNYKRGEVYPDSVDMDEEKDRIAAEVEMDVNSRIIG